MRDHLLIFIALLCLVIILQYLLVSEYLNFGMHSDDWISLIRFKSLDADLFEKIQIFWKRHGPHVTSQIMYMGMLESLFGLNYQLFAHINIGFKILATISFYPLFCLLFRRKLLAFIAVILYAVSYSTVGTLHDVHKGTEYQAIFFMNIFFIIYLLFSQRQKFSLGWFLLLIVSFATSILLAPPRLFPLTFLPLLIELFMWIHFKSSYNFKLGLKKIFGLYLPFGLIFALHPEAVTGAFIIPYTHYMRVIEGYWFTILNPVAGLGYMILWDSYWVNLIGTLNINSFTDYLLSILTKISIIFGTLGLFLAMMFAKNMIKFVIMSVFLISLINIGVFFLATYHLTIPEQHRTNFDFNILYPVFIGVSILVLCFCFYIDWLYSKKDNLLILGVWLGPALGFFFVFNNWLFGDVFLSFSPTQQYLTVPAAGISLMIASILILFVDKLKSIKFLNIGSFLAIISLAVFFISAYPISKSRIDDFLVSIVRQNNAVKQIDIQQKLHQSIRHSDNILVFFDWKDDLQNEGFYSETIHSSFPFWMHYKEGVVVEGCINGTTDIETLAKSYIEKDNNRGFLWQGVCLGKYGNFFLKQDVFYDLGNFYAFEINNNNLLNIKERVLAFLGI